MNKKKILIIAFISLISITVLTYIILLHPRKYFIIGQITQACLSEDKLFFETETSNIKSDKFKLTRRWLNLETGYIKKEKVLKRSMENQEMYSLDYGSHFSTEFINAIKCHLEYAYNGTYIAHYYEEENLFFVIKYQNYYSRCSYLLYDPSNNREFYQTMYNGKNSINDLDKKYIFNADKNYLVYLSSNELRCIDLIKTYKEQQETVLWKQYINEDYDNFKIVGNEVYAVLLLFPKEKDISTKIKIYDIQMGKEINQYERNNIEDIAINENDDIRLIVQTEKSVLISEYDVKSSNDRIIYNKYYGVNIPSTRRSYLLKHSTLCEYYRYRTVTPRQKLLLLTFLDSNSNVEISYDGYFEYFPYLTSIKDCHYLYFLNKRFYYQIDNDNVKNKSLVGYPVQIVENDKYLIIVSIDVLNKIMLPESQWEWKYISCIYVFRK